MEWREPTSLKLLRIAKQTSQDDVSFWITALRMYTVPGYVEGGAVITW